MSKYYGYTCTTSVKYNREDKEARKKTKQYQLLVSKCSEQQIILEEIYSDLLSDFYKTREELGKLCQIVEYDDVIVIDSIFALGTTLFDINDNMMLLFGSCHLKVLSTYEGIDFSTVDTSDDDLDVMNRKLNEFATLLGGKEAKSLLPFANYQGRPTIPLTKEIIDVYWMYENYFIDEQTASDNIHYKMAKNSFRAKCRLYELSDSYKQDLDYQHTLYQTANKPKRHGKLPDWFTDAFVTEVESDPDAIEEVCIRHNVFPISKLEYNRWKLKATSGRKGLFETSKEFQNKELITSLQKI